MTGFGAADSDTLGAGASPSVIVTCTELVAPANTEDGRLPRATVNVSSSWSASSVVVIVPVPLVRPESMVMDAKAP